VLLSYPFACAYDGAGNLFVDGYHLHSGVNFALSELPAGSTAFERLKVVGEVGLAGNLQWDGTDLAVGDYQNPTVIYQIRVSKQRPEARLKGTITLDGPVTKPTHGVQFWLTNGALIMPFGTTRNVNKVGFWNYPAGGKATGTLKGFDVAELYGVTISVPPTAKP